MRSWTFEALDRLGVMPELALVTMAAVAGSVPRGAGTKMILSADDVWGTIGGGALEHNCIQQARALLRRPGVVARAQDYPLGPLLGQCCGGRVRIALERLTLADQDWLGAAALMERDGVDHQLVLPLSNGARTAIAGWPEGVDSPAVALFDKNGAALTVQSKEQWVRRIEYVRPRERRVVLVGGGHVGAALAAILRGLPVRLDWIDPRVEEGGLGYGGARFSDDPVRDVQFAPSNSAFVIMTHSHALDFDLCAAALARGDALYCGVIGSRTKRQRFLNRLAAAGLSDAQCDRLVSPIGALGLTSKEPSVIALAVAAELMLKFEAFERTV